MKVYFFLSIVLFSLVLSATCLQIPQRIQNNDFEFPNNNPSLKNSVLFEKCIEIPVLGNTCLQIFDHVQNLTLGIALSFNNRTLFQDDFGLGNDCLDTQSILYLVAEIPVLKPFRFVLDWIISESKKIPAEIFSVCLQMYNVSTSNNGTVLHACAELNSTVACWKGKCAYEGIDHFGCFSVNIPNIEYTIPSLPAFNEESPKTKNSKEPLMADQESNMGKRKSKYDDDILW